MTKLSPKMVAMLRHLANSPNSIASVPYRLGAARTIAALIDRGLVNRLYRSPGVFVTDAGKAMLAELDKENP